MKASRLCFGRYGALIVQDSASIFERSWAGAAGGSELKARARLTLIVTRLGEVGERVIGGRHLHGPDETKAEIAMAVADEFQGKGIGTILMERLAVLAARHGSQRFWAVMQSHNQAMLEVFRQSGFECRQTTADGEVEIDLSVTPSEASVARSKLRERVATTASLGPFFSLDPWQSSVTSYW